MVLIGPNRTSLTWFAPSQKHIGGLAGGSVWWWLVVQLVVEKGRARDSLIKQ